LQDWTWASSRRRFARWLKALEAKSAQEGLVLTEAQVVALARAKTEKEARGEFESEHPGYCGAPRHARSRLRRQAAR